MADDKTAAEHAAEDRYPSPGRGTVGSFERSAFVAGAAWQAEQAVCRVAPDRETLAKIIAEGPGEAGYNPAPFGQLFGGNAARRIADALLASGVLGVPADERTADRETIIDALIQKNDHKVTENGRGGYRCEAGDFEVDWQKADRDRIRRHVAGFQADAVLAVLVPADQVRAETLEAFGTAPIPGFEHWTESKKDAAARIYDLIRARAAEYRKKAGA